MKTAKLSLIFLSICTGIFAQSAYEQAMLKALNNLQNLESDQQMQTIASQFDRIAKAEAEEWLPSYYASYLYCLLAFSTEDKVQKELFIVEAQKRLEVAASISSEESEIYTLQGMIYQATIGLDPAKNGWKYSTKANGSFETAMKLDPINPRPYYLQGLSVMNTPKMFGGGKTKALPLLMEAIEKFDNFEPESELSPNWGKEDCEYNYKICQDTQASL